MPVDVILGTIGAVVATISALFGGGLLKQAFAHSNAIAINKHDLEANKIRTKDHEEKLHKLTTEVALLSKDVLGFEGHIKKLELIPEINSQLATMNAMFAFFKEEFKELRKELQDHHG